MIFKKNKKDKEKENLEPNEKDTKTQEMKRLSFFTFIKKNSYFLEEKTKKEDSCIFIYFLLNFFYYFKTHNNIFWILQNVEIIYSF